MEEDLDVREVPEGWIVLTIKDLVSSKKNAIKRGPFGSSIKKSFFVPEGFKIYEQKNIIYNDFAAGNYFISEEKFRELEDFEIRSGDFIISCSGTIGKIAIVPNGIQRGIINQALLKITLNEEKILSKYFFLLCNSERFQKKIARNTHGSTMQNISSVSDIKKITILLPPLSEQQRIVAYVEALLTHINTASNRLSRVPWIMKKFRQVVLVAACEGWLTEEWRENHRNKIQTPSLTDLLSHRKVLWKLRNSKFSSQLKNKTHQKYKEPKEPSKDNIVDLPVGWIPITVSQIAFLDVGFSFSSKEFQDSGIKLLRGENIEPGSLRWRETKYWSEDQIDDYQHLLLEDGEIVLGMDRPLISTGFKIARVTPEDLPCLLVQRVTRFKMVDPEYTDILYYNLQNEKFQKYLAENGLTGSALPHITGSAVKDYTLGLPSKEESNEITRRVNALFARADAFDRQVVAASRRCERLTQAVLGKAFRGELISGMESESHINP